MITARGAAIAMPVLVAWFDDPEFEGSGLVLICVGADALSAVDALCVDADLTGKELVEGATLLEEIVEGATLLEEVVEGLGVVTDVVPGRLSDETDADDVVGSEGKLGWPGSRSKAEKGNGWRLVGFSVQQSPSSMPVCPGMPLQHQLLSPHRCT